MRPRKLTFLFIIPIIFLVGSAFAQTPALQTALNLTSEQYEALVSEVTATNPIAAEDLPIVGEFYFWQNSSLLASPGNFFALSGWDLGNGIYLLDDVHFQPQFHSGSRRMEDDGSGSTNGFSYSFDTNGLWLEMTGVSNGLSYLNLHNATNMVYAIWSTTNLMGGCSVETEVWPTNSSVMPFQVPTASRSNLFLQAEDWTSVTHGGNTTPDWWFWEYFGGTGLTLSDTNLDSWGNQLLGDYENNLDPNEVMFTLNVSNNYVNTITPTLGLNIASGWPEYVAVVEDDTNYEADAVWQPYTGTNLVLNLGSAGWHQVWVGLRGFALNGHQTWQYKRLKVDYTPPDIVLTSPAPGSTLNLPLVQLTGYSSEALRNISYDIANAAGLLTNQSVSIVDQSYDTNNWEFATNSFQAFDVLLTNGVNTITLHATDLAGNACSAIFNLTLDYSTRTNPPVVNLYWPQNDTHICSGPYTWRGWINDPSASVTAQLVDSSGDTNLYYAIVGRDGNFWVENLPFDGGTNSLLLTVTDSAGNIATTNITVMPAPVTLTITTPSSDQLWNPTITVTGTISDWTNYSVWVNGVEAVLTNNGAWAASNVYLPTNGTAVLEARAIPNSDNGGAGTGGSGGSSASYANMGNPASAQENDLELSAAKPMRTFIKSYTVSDSGTEDYSDNYQDDQGNPAASPYGNTWDDFKQIGVLSGNWQDGSGGSSSYSATQISSAQGYPSTTNQQTAQVDYADSLYPNIVVASSVPDGASSPFAITGEHCDIGVPALDLSGVYLQSGIPANDKEIEKDTGTRHADAKVVCHTPPPASPGEQSVYLIHVDATQMLSAKWPLPFYDTPEPATILPVPPESISIGGYGNLDTNGDLYVQLPDDQDVDITPRVDGMDYFIYGVPTPQKFTLSHLTEATAQGNKDSTRTTVGVGEIVDLDGMPGNTLWSVSSGTLSATNGGSTTFTAPGVAGTSKVTGTVENVTLTLTFGVVAPSQITYQFASARTFPAGLQGVGMWTTVTLLPINVSFYRVQYLELPSGATNVTGFFATLPPSNLEHPVNPNWVGFTEANIANSSDYAGFDSVPPPWYSSEYDWNIPIAWQVINSNATNVFTHVLQQMIIQNSAGTSTVIKGAAQTTRTP